MAVDDSTTTTPDIDYSTDDRTTDVARESGVLPAEFGERHNVHPAFVPFDCRRFNPVNLLETTRKVIEATPGTTHHVARARVAKYHDGLKSANRGAVPRNLPTEFFLLWGAYPCEDRSGSSGSQSVQFANPTTFDHTELYSVTNRDERIAWLDRYASLGILKLDTVYPHFGMTCRESLESFMHRHDYSWRETRRPGTVRMARTFKLINEWGHSQTDIARAFGCSASAIRNYYARYVDDEWEVPADPTVP